MALQKTIPLGQDEKEKMEQIWNSNFILKNMGVKIDLSDDYLIKAVLDPVLPMHRGGLGTAAVNGVVLSALFDLTIGLVGIVNSRNHRTGTVQLNINFLRPVWGNSLTVEGRLVKQGKSLVFARGEIFDEKKELCATCDGICSIDFNKPEVEGFVAI